MKLDNDDDDDDDDNNNNINNNNNNNNNNNKPFNEEGKPVRGYRQGMFREWRDIGLFESKGFEFQGKFGEDDAMEVETAE